MTLLTSRSRLHCRLLLYQRAYAWFCRPIKKRAAHQNCLIPTCPSPQPPKSPKILVAISAKRIDGFTTASMRQGEIHEQQRNRIRCYHRGAICLL